MSFLIFEAEKRLENSNLVKLTRVIEWEKIKKRMGNLGRSGYGPSGYSPVGLLKALILQAWHSLSDEALEEALRVRLDFMAITQLVDVPDHTTLCRFRNLLTKLNLWDKILKEVNNQLASGGLKIKESQGAIIDATIVESAARPNKEIDAIVVDRAETAANYKVETKAISLSKDQDARWLKKGKRSYFGYKGFMVIDKEDGYIEQVHVTPANKSEVSELKTVLHGQFYERLYGDKGYASSENKELLSSKGIKNGIMEKAKKNKPLNHWQKIFNKLISKVRYKVEQGFGTLKRKFKFTRASYFTTKKVHAQMAVKAIAFNLLKAINKVVLVKNTPGFYLG